MIFGSVCSGIEAATVAWGKLGWKAAFFSEIEKFPSKVLAHHHPDVPNEGDMTKFKEWKQYAIRLLCGGTPCQSFSIAGLRKGLDDARGNLMLVFAEMAARFRPQWIFWENVPGVLSSNGGRDFASFLGLISGRNVPVPDGGWGKSGVIPGYKNAYGIAYRVFDAQYFGVAQRRRRVFVVGHLGDWHPAAAVLFERESLCGNPAPRREAGQKIAPCVTNGPTFSRTGNERVECEAMVVAERHGMDYEFNAHDVNEATGPLLKGSPSGGGHPLPPVMDVSTHRMVAFGEYVDDGTASAMKARDYKDATDLISGVAQTLRREGFDASEDGTGRQNLVPMAYAIQERAICENPDAGPGGVGVRDDNAAYRLEARQTPQAVAFQQNQLGEVRQGAVSGTLNTNSNASGRNTPMAQVGMAVRRLTPVECERLQGFPDNYTLIPMNDKGGYAADGPRYKALGNSWAVPNVEWIGNRINLVDKMLQGEV